MRAATIRGAASIRGTHHACSHITLMTFTRFAQNSTSVGMLALYGSTMHVATCIYTSLIPSVQHCRAGNRALDLGIYYAMISEQFFST